MEHKKKGNIEKKIMQNGVVLMMCASFVFSVLGALVKHIGQEIPAIEIVFLRSLFSFLIILPVIFRHNMCLETDQKRFLILRGLSGFCAFSLFYYAITKVHLTKVSVIMQTRPFVVMILAHFFLKERLTSKELRLVIISFIGVLLLIKPNRAIAGINIDMVSLACVMGVFFAATSAVLVKHVTQSVSSVCIIFYFMLVSTICSTPFVISSFIVPATKQTVIIIVITILSLVAQWLMTEAIRFSKTTIAMVVGYTSVIFSTFWELLFWHTPPDLFTIGGAVLVGISVILMARSKTFA